MKKAEDLAMRIIRNGIMWEEEISIQDTAALIRADREEVIDECKIAGMRYLDNLENAALVSEGGFQGFFDALDTLKTI